MTRRDVYVVLITIVVLLGSAGSVQANDGIDRLTNEFRVLYERRSLHTNLNLTRLARQRARQIVTDFSHSFEWLNRTRCEAGGENLAYRRPALDGYKARWFVEAWKASETHRRVMLGRGWRRMGSAIYIGPDGGMYGVQLFCDPR